MRTTLNLDDDVLKAARSLAAATGRSLGTVVSELMRKGLNPPSYESSSLPAFEVKADSPLVTPEMVKEALDDEW